MRYKSTQLEVAKCSWEGKCVQESERGMVAEQDGDTSLRERQRLIDAFNAPGCRVPIFLVAGPMPICPHPCF